VHEIGSAVTNVQRKDTVIVHPFISCGLCKFCRAGDDMHCLIGSFPGIDRETIDVISREISSSGTSSAPTPTWST